ncbi:hypothetical protein U1Q18_016804 [Sarracenia purpurea var. burkii]
MAEANRCGYLSLQPRIQSKHSKSRSREGPKAAQEVGAVVTGHWIAAFVILV